jgi:transcriptional regulator ATRX
MKKRAHILHMMLESCVQRKDYSVITSVLKPKHEYVLSIRLSDKQIELYRGYLGHRGIENIANLGVMKGAQLFSDFQNMSRIWTHPHVIRMHELRLIRAEEKETENNFLADEAEEEEDSEAAAQLEGFVVDDDEDADDVIDLDDENSNESLHSKKTNDDEEPKHK